MRVQGLDGVVLVPTLPRERVAVKVEKAVDVMVAVDMVSMALRGEYESAYVLSADGDLTPAVEEVRRMGKSVYIASPNRGAQLAAAARARLAQGLAPADSDLPGRLLIRVRVRALLGLGPC